MCMLCKCDTVKQSTTTHVVNYNGSVIIIKNVPCEECDQCGEIFYTDEVAEPNSFAICATKAAFNQSEDWLNELNQYIQNNKDYAISFIQKEIKDVYVVPTEATYLLWIDCHKVCLDSVELTSFIRKKTGLYVSDGLEYGENGKAFIRMNVACPFERLKDGLDRFKEGIYLYQNK